MKIRYTTRVCSMVLAMRLVSVGSIPARAQETDHAVSPSQLRNDVQKAAATRQANEAALRDLFASKDGAGCLRFFIRLLQSLAGIAVAQRN
jgi:hypothetical protein